MPTLTPTYDDRATSLPMPMTSPDPHATMTEDRLDGFLAGSGMNGPFLAGFLSMTLTHERCGVHLARSLTERTRNPILKARYKAFAEKGLGHVATLEQAVTDLGGDPYYVAPIARAVEAADDAALESTYKLNGSIDAMTQEAVMLDAFLLASARSHENWSTLQDIVAKLPEGGSDRDTLRRAVESGEDDKDDQLAWAKDMRKKMIEAQASSTATAALGSKVEEAVATVKNWFS
jgi:hypothetical protein